MLVSPPRGWPESFNSPALQAYIEKLDGKRVRLVGLPGPSDVAKVAKLKLDTTDTDSLSVAKRVRKLTGWPIVAGYALFERSVAPSGSPEYVSNQRWWNAKKEAGKWIDVTPREADIAELVLVESGQVATPPLEEASLAKAPKAPAVKSYLDPKLYGPQQPGIVYGSMSSSVSREFKVCAPRCARAQ